MDLLALRYGIFQHACQLVNAPNASKELRARSEVIIMSMYDVYDQSTEVIKKAADRVANNVNQQVSGIVVP